MNKASKDIGLLYEKMYAPVRQNTINESLGGMVLGGISKIYKYLLGIGEGTPGIKERFFILRKFSSQYFQKYRDLQYLGNATNQFLVNLKKIKSKDHAARMSFYSAELAKMRPTFIKLEINPTVLDTSFNTGRLQPELQAALNEPVINLVNLLSKKTGLPNYTIDQVFKDSSVNTATQLLKAYMPVMANVNKDALRVVGIGLGGLLIWRTVQLASKVFETGGKLLDTTEKTLDALGQAAEVTTTVISGAETGLRNLQEAIQKTPGFDGPDDQSAPTQQPPTSTTPAPVTPSTTTPAPRPRSWSPAPTPLPSSGRNPFK